MTNLYQYFLSSWNSIVWGILFGQIYVGYSLNNIYSFICYLCHKAIGDIQENMVNSNFLKNYTYFGGIWKINMN